MEMNKNYRTQGDQEGDIYDQIHHLIENQPRKWQSVAAATGLMGGLLCPVLGTLLTAIGWLLVRQRAISVLHILSIVCFALTIPLLACGAHCLDLIERKKVTSSSSLGGHLTRNRSMSLNSYR
jgi:ABC-type transport system involved in cytochrome c biogenesis permease component